MTHIQGHSSLFFVFYFQQHLSTDSMTKSKVSCTFMEEYKELRMSQIHKVENDWHRDKDRRVQGVYSNQRDRFTLPGMSFHFRSRRSEACVKASLQAGSIKKPHSSGCKSNSLDYHKKRKLISEMNLYSTCPICAVQEHHKQNHTALLFCPRLLPSASHISPPCAVWDKMNSLSLWY